MLNALGMYKIVGSSSDRDITVAAANINGALEMAQEQVDGKWPIFEVRRLGTIFVEQPDVE